MFGCFRQRVYLHLFAVLALGIAAGYHWPLPTEMLAADRVLLALPVIGLLVLWWVWRDEPSPAAIVPGYIALLAVGYFAASLSIRLPQTAPLRHYAGTAPRVLIGRVVSTPKLRAGHLRFLMHVDQVVGVKEPADGLCFAYVKCDAMPELGVGDRVRLWATLREQPPAANHGQFDFRRYLLMRGTTLTTYSPSADCLTRLTGRGPPAMWWVSRLQQRLTGNLAHGLPPDYGQLAISVVYGDKVTDLSEEMQERFRRAGLTHILVASGTQVSLLILLLVLLSWRLSTGFGWRAAVLRLVQFVLTLAAVILYAAVTGFETSIVRALVMGACILLGRLLRREADGMTALAQSALILLVVNPLTLFSPGFQLSFGATFGLIYVAGAGFPLVAGLARGLRALFQTLITTGGAQLFVAPILAVGFQQVSLWGLVSNLIAIPLSFVLLAVGGLASLGLGSLPLLGPALTAVTYALCWLLDHVAWLFARLPGSDLAVPPAPLWWVAAYYLLLLLVGEWTKVRRSLGTAGRVFAQVACGVLALVLIAGVLGWLLIPRPEFAALCLSGSEAYIWRPYTGGCILFVRSAGLARSHNAETVDSAVRWRGINRVDGVVWLDEPLSKNPFNFSARHSLSPGSAAPPAWDMAWIIDGGRACGAELSLAPGMVQLLWDKPPLAWLDAQAAGPGITPVTIVSRKLWPDLDAATVEGLARTSSCIVVSQGTTRIRSARDVLVPQSELRILPHGKTLVLQEMALPGP
jgi:competence protein ComEC